MSTKGNSDSDRIYPSAMVKPLVGTVSRAPGSIRRTSSITMQLDAGVLHLEGAARDLRTRSADSEVVADASIAARVSSAKVLEQLHTTPTRDATDAVLGLVVGHGFREALGRHLTDEMAASTPLALLLDDMPVATVISGYVYLYSDALPAQSGSAPLKADICSGWRSDGTMLVAFREKGAIPIPVGPPATVLEPPDDPIGWHPVGDLPAGAMRRRRLVDVGPGPTSDVLLVQAMFRDTFADLDGAETVVHEYVLTATVDRETHVLRTCDAIPRVLPWVECPVAAASAWKLIGHPVERVRDLVRTDLRGTSTCTHLNDLLRSLGDVAALIDAMP